MNTPNSCPQCGAKLPADVPEALCPACLMSGALPTSLDTVKLADQPWTQGSRVKYLGNYELLEEIAAGGMGVVYKARQSSLNRVVAVKMIRSGEFAGEEEVRRFFAEAEAAAQLKHPNIVAIHEIGEHEGRHYFSMDFVDGKNLAQVADGKPVPARQAAEWVKTIAEAVQFAHQRGVLHRDLKPQNILVDAEGRPHVTDFGLAKNLHADSGLTQSGTVMGSPSYMAPEQARGRNDLVGPASDVYSLGAILYQMLTGRAPFLAGSAAETMMQVMNDEPKRPRSLHADTPVDLETICLKCLEKDPMRRYPTARALAEDVGRFLAGEPVLARPAGLMRRMVSWTRRRPAVLAVLAALVVFVLAGIVFYLVEENAFLRAKQTAPDLVRQRGPRTDAFGKWMLLMLLITFASIPVLFGFLKNMRRVSWSDLFDPVKMTPLQSAGSRWRKVMTGAGLACAGAGVALLAKLIQAQVWETDMDGSLWMLPFVCLWFGGFMAWFAWMDHRLSMTGTPRHQLSTTQADAIREAVREMDMGEAVRLYREAVPGAGRGEANQHVLRVAAELREREPERFEAVATRKLNPFRLNLLPMTVCGMIEGIAAYVLLRMLPEQPLAPVLSRFGVAFCYGVGLVLMGRARSLAPRLLVIAGGIAAGLILLRLFPAPQTPMQGADVFLVGMLFGIAVIACGYFWKRGKAAGASLPANVPDVTVGATVAAQTQALIPSAAIPSAVSIGATGAVAGPLIGLAGGILGTKASIENTKSPRERLFMVKMSWWTWIGVLIFCALITGITTLGRPLAQSHLGWFLAAIFGLVLIYVSVLVWFVRWANRRQRQIRQEDGTAAPDDTTKPNTPGGQV